MTLIVEYLDKSRLPKKRKRYETAAPASLATLPAVIDLIGEPAEVRQDRADEIAVMRVVGGQFGGIKIESIACLRRRFGP